MANLRESEQEPLAFHIDRHAPASVRATVPRRARRPGPGAESGHN